MTFLRFIKLGIALTAFIYFIVGCGDVEDAVDPDEQLRSLARESLSQIEGDLTLEGLNEQVEVVRDQHGIPHIYAQNTDDLFFAQGYVMAQDRLWQLEMWRRWREGHLAEIFGPEACDYDARARLMM